MVFSPYTRLRRFFRYDKNGTVKVCDFGLSQLFEKGQKIMDEKRPKGTPLYMAPEVWLGREFNEKADVYRYGDALILVVSMVVYCTVFGLLNAMFVALVSCSGSSSPASPPSRTTRRWRSSR